MNRNIIIDIFPYRQLSTINVQSVKRYNHKITECLADSVCTNVLK